MSRTMIGPLMLRVLALLCVVVGRASADSLDGESSLSPDFPLYLASGYVKPSGSGGHEALSGNFSLALGSGYKPIVLGGSSAATGGMFALNLIPVSEGFATSATFPLDTHPGVEVLSPAAQELWLTGESTIIRITWQVTNDRARRLRIRYSTDNGSTWPDNNVLANDVLASDLSWQGTRTLPAANGVVGRVRIEAFDQSGAELPAVEGQLFALANATTVRFDVQRLNTSVVAPPILYWDRQAGASYYVVEVTADGRTSCENDYWATNVADPQSWVAFDAGRWASFPATRTDVKVTAYNANHSRVGQPQTKTLVKFKLSDLDPYNTEAYTAKPPVLLVHGWNSDQSTWYKCDASPLVQTLINGRPGERFHPWAFEYPNIGSIRHSAAGLRAAVDYLLGLPSAADSVRLVAHSMGGLVCRTYVQGLAVDPKDDPEAGPKLSGPVRVSHLVTLSSPLLGEPEGVVNSAALFTKIGCSGITGSTSTDDLKSRSSLITALNQGVLPQMRYFFAGGLDSDGERKGKDRQAFLGGACPYGSDATVDICSARGDCLGDADTFVPLSTLSDGAVVIRAQYLLSHGRMALPGNTAADCSSTQKSYDQAHTNESLRLLSDVVGFLRCGPCLVSADCPRPNGKAVTHVVVTRSGGGNMLASWQSLGRARALSDDSALPGAQLRIIPLDAPDSSAAATLTTNALGQATIDLSPGQYIASISAHGFASRAETLAVDAEGGLDTRRVDLTASGNYEGPRGPTVALQGGGLATEDSVVTLTLSCEGASEMEVTEEPSFAGAAWQPYNSAAGFTLRGGVGVHTIYARFRNAVGVESDPATTDVTELGPISGRLAVTSTPSGAEILVDGASTGLRTPATISPLAVGFHRVWVAFPGQHASPDVAIAHVDSGSTATVGFTFKGSSPPSAPTWQRLGGPEFLKAGDALTWHRALDPDLGDPIFYDVAIMADSALSHTVWSALGTADTSVVLPASLADSTDYFATVRAVDGTGVFQAAVPDVAHIFVDQTAPAGRIVTPDSVEVAAGASRAIHLEVHDWGGLSQMTVWLSKNAGGTFPDTVYAGAYADSVLWSPPQTGADSCVLRAVVTDRAGNVGTLESGLFAVRPGIVAVESEGLPIALALGVSPNPSRGPLQVTLALPRAGRVEVAAFDVAGRKVRDLVRASWPAGRVRLAWDGRGNGGQALASGIYFMRLATEYGVLRRQIVLLR